MENKKHTAAFETEAAETVSGAAARAARKKSRLYRPAVALLGLLVIALSVVGVISLVTMGVNSYRNSRQQLKDELTYFISPLAYYTPTAFDDVNRSDQDALLLSAIYKLTEEERIRQLREDDLEYTYEIDDYGRLALPIADVAEAYASLYGAEAEPLYRTIGETDSPYSCYEYNAAKELYYVPADSSESLYNILVDTVKNRGDTYTLDVCYVPESNLKIDERGNTVAPTRSDAQYIQQYTLLRTETGWQITAVADMQADGSTTTASSEEEELPDEETEAEAEADGETETTASTAKATTTTKS